MRRVRTASALRSVTVTTPFLCSATGRSRCRPGRAAARSARSCRSAARSRCGSPSLDSLSSFFSPLMVSTLTGQLDVQLLGVDAGHLGPHAQLALAVGDVDRRAQGACVAASPSKMRPKSFWSWSKRWKGLGREAQGAAAEGGEAVHGGSPVRLRVREGTLGPRPPRKQAACQPQNRPSGGRQEAVLGRRDCQDGGRATVKATAGRGADRAASEG